MNEKVTYVGVNNASIAMDNSVDTEKMYNISANVNVGNAKNVTSVDNGNVTKDGMTKASFSRYGENGLSVQFYTQGVAEMCAVATAIDGFLNDVVAKVSEGEVLSNVL